MNHHARCKLCEAIAAKNDDLCRWCLTKVAEFSSMSAQERCSIALRDFARGGYNPFLSYYNAERTHFDAQFVSRAERANSEEGK